MPWSSYILTSRRIGCIVAKRGDSYRCGRCGYKFKPGDKVWCRHGKNGRRYYRCDRCYREMWTE